ncbi:penicillin-binding protein 2 [uncultured Granulicatella sp.]|uniref:peptidoglycan D,D-transpeptidase FtsI family protein n=1 Tax=uncultured Granulicatella sp. TaxID=316089 RepID=UPI0028D7F971|nr:penicillin-binding protein 2 [uncultured Granulicatella sp.]
MLTKRKLKQKKKKSHIPFRLNLLFLIVFFSFIALISRLAYIQLVKGDEFVALVQRTETTTAKKSVPRGSIYDSQGRVLVGNKPKLAINYTRPADVKTSTMLEIAKKLTTLISVDASELKERDLKDYWVATNPDKVDSLLTADEKKKIAKENLSTSQTYEMQLEHIPNDELNYSDAEKQVIAIFTKMNSAYALSTVTLKNEGVTEQEVAKISERLGELRGVDVDSDWDREYPMGDMLKTILGTVSSEKTGLPSDKVKSLLAQGYSLNDRVGTSYLEEQYETVLSGTKTVVKSQTNTKGEVVNSTETYPGKGGSNLVLTIDTEFQKKIEEIATKSVEAMTDPAADRVYIVVMNPKNGDVLGITGKKKKFDENFHSTGVEDDALGAINNSFGMGSVVKPATVLSGYMDGAITLDDNTIVDEPIEFEASKPKSSWFNRNGKIELTDLDALERSSNAYMIKLVMKMGGQSKYEKGGRLNINLSLFDKLREYFAQFGLGVRTGIDLPNEGKGYNGGSADAFAALDFAFGQFDLYTPLQLAQYMSTIANGGTRIAPRLVKEIHETSPSGGIGNLEDVVPTKIMNSIQVSKEILDHIKEGLYRVTHGENGTSATTFRTYSPEVAGKTGSDEAFYSGPNPAYKNEAVENSTFISYAPYDNPEIVVAVVAPFFKDGSPSDYAAKVGKQVYDAYFGKSSSSSQTNEATVNSQIRQQQNNRR